MGFSLTCFNRELQRLGARPDRQIVVLETIDSTSSELRRRLRKHAGPGTVVIADLQTRGRGRRGRDWCSSHSGNLYLSMAVALSGPSRDTIPMLPLAAGLALFDAVHASSGLTPELKWPNDLLLSGKKAAGILTEVFELLPDRARAIVGVGVNLTQTEFPEELGDIATSVSREGGALSTVEEMAARFVIELESRLAIIEAGDKRPIVDEWRQKAELFGRRVRIGDLEGITRDLAPDGRLILKTDRGEEVLVAGGIVEPVD